MNDWRSPFFERIEMEFDEPVRDTIIGLREQHNTWKTVAGILGINQMTLHKWRRKLGLPYNHSEKFFDELSNPGGTQARVKLENRIRQMGYQSITDAVIQCRMTERKTIRVTARKLRIGESTVRAYTPDKLRGELCVNNRSARWWKVRRRQAKEMRRLSKTTKGKHPWRIANDYLKGESK